MVRRPDAFAASRVQSYCRSVETCLVEVVFHPFQISKIEHYSVNARFYDHIFGCERFVYNVREIEQ